MASKEVIGKAKNLAMQIGEIMGTEVLLAQTQPSETQRRAISQRLRSLERQLRRVCMEAGLPVVEMSSDASPFDNGFDAGRYYLVTYHPDKEVSAVISWRATADDFDVMLAWANGSRMLLSEWDSKAELVVTDNSADAPQCE